ncbi:MAG: sulfotransferase domain-containing protein [Bacteroidota bacterium]
MKLDFVIIGGQKCGSTYVQRVIENHPEVEMIEGECPHFEDPDYQNDGLVKLQQRLALLDQKKLLGIKRPNYLGKPEVPDRIFKANSDIKVIVILRNPLDRFKSAYFHQMNYGVGPTLPLNIGAERILSGAIEKEYPRSKEVLQFGLYAEHLKKYVALFDKNILILTFDELKNDHLGLIKKCYTFLGVDNVFIPHKILDERPMKVNYAIRSVKFLNLRNPLRFEYNEDKTRMYPKKRNIVDKAGIKTIELVNDLIFGKILKKEGKPKFSDEIKSKLLRWYAKDIAQLEILIQKDLSNWKS